VEYNGSVFLYPYGACGTNRNAGGFFAVVTGPGIIPEPGGAVGLKAFPRFEAKNPAKILARPEVVFVFTGYLAGLAGNAPAHIKIKPQFSHISYIPYTFTKIWYTILHINPLIIIGL
jgi:hypothetical protein